MQFLTFIIVTIIQLYIIFLLLRIWMQIVGINFSNPFLQFIVKSTEPTVGFFRNFIPVINNIDFAALFVSYIFTWSNIIFIMWFTNTISLINLSLIPISFIQLCIYAGKLIFWLILIRSISSWITQQHQIDYTLIQLTEPFISPIRKIIPMFNGIDLSPMIVMFILMSLNYLRLDILLFINPTITSILYSINYFM
uniref:YggT family protein n=1 Tax=Candidatus Aschnera chinzeii TaxID=1485666 RepID=A0AAT9G446_9ENTR|nr:MAG: YggT family protein [Candidatus Aschnera chinzeii]